MIKTIEKKEKRLQLELQSTSINKLVYEGIYIISDMKSVNSESFYVMLSKYKHIKNKLYNANR